MKVDLCGFHLFSVAIDIPSCCLLIINCVDRGLIENDYPTWINICLPITVVDFYHVFRQN